MKKNKQQEQQVKQFSADDDDTVVDNVEFYDSDDTIADSAGYGVSSAKGNNRKDNIFKRFFGFVCAKKIIFAIIASVLIVAIVVGLLFVFVFKGDSFDPSMTYTGKVAIAELSDGKIKNNVSIEVETPTEKVTEVRIDNKTLEYYSYNGKELLLKKKVLNNLELGAGEHFIKIYYDNSVKNIRRTLYVATKVIRNCEDFQAMGDLPSGWYILGNDIDFKNFGYFEPIGEYYGDGRSSNRIFNGTLEGNGYKVKNIKIKSSECKKEAHRVNFVKELGANLGIFSYVGDTGRIRNVTFENCTVETDSLIAGVVVGTNNGVIQNCLVTGGKVESTMSQYTWLDFNCFIAGFAGINGGSGVIKNCICAVDGVEYSANPKCVRVFCGKNWGTIIDSVGANDGVVMSDITNAPTKEQIDADPNTNYDTSSIDTRDYYDGFTYTAIQAQIGYMGTVENCYVSDSFEITQSHILYEDFDTEIWTFIEDEFPSINRIIK